MPVSADDARMRLVETLDGLLLSFRRQLDDEDPTAAVPVLSGLKATSLGIVPTRYDRGVIFGLDVCQIDDVMPYGSNMPGPMVWTLPDGIFPGDWVVSIGALHDGDKSVNLWASMQVPYVYRVVLPTSLRGANCYAMGAIVYDCNTGVMSTRLLGGTPPITIEKGDITLERMLRAALREDPQDTDFKVTETADEILVARMLIDVESATAAGAVFTLHTSNGKRRHPLPSGIPCEQYADMAVLVQKAIRVVDQASFDTTTVYELMLNICDAATWGTSFYDYWITPGRSLPSNTKHYYNALFAPPYIP